MFHQNFQSDYFIGTRDIAGPFSAYSEHTQIKEEPIDVIDQFRDKNGEVDPIMEEKKQIVEARSVTGKGKVRKISTKDKVEPAKPIPGMKLMKKLHKQHQIERSLGRIIKDLS